MFVKNLANQLQNRLAETPDGVYWAESIVQIRWAYSNKRQSAYATAQPNGDLDQSHPFEGTDIIDHMPNMNDNAALYGKGHEFATREDILAWDTKYKRTFRATSKILGREFAFHLGNIAQTNLGGGAYQYVMTYQDPLAAGFYGAGRQLPVFTVVEQVHSGLIRQFPSNVVVSIDLTGKLVDWVKALVNYQGSGMKTVLGSFNFPDSTTAAGNEGDLFRNAALLFQLSPSGGQGAGNAAPSGSYVDTSCDIVSWRFQSAYTFFEQDGYCPGSGYLVSGDPTSGQIRARLEFDKRAVLFEFVARVTAGATTLITELEKTTLMAVKMTLTGSAIASSGYHHSCLIEIPATKWKAVPIAVDKNMIVYNVSAIVFYDTSVPLNDPFRVTIVNDNANNYLVSS